MAILSVLVLKPAYNYLIATRHIALTKIRGNERKVPTAYGVLPPTGSVSLHRFPLSEEARSILPGLHSVTNSTQSFVFLTYEINEIDGQTGNS